MKLESVVHIDAPPNVVWTVTEDIERWPEWTPSVESVKRIDQAQFDVGSTALIKQPGLPEAKWFVTAFTRGERFTWESRVRGIRMIATHEIRAAASGTQSVLRVEMSGLVAVLLWPLIRFSARRLLEQENAGIKDRCETVGIKRNRHHL